MKMQNRNLIKWLILIAALWSPMGLRAQTFLTGDWTSSTVTVGVDTNGTLLATAPLNSSFTFNSTETSTTNPQFLWVPALSALRAGKFYNAPSTTTMGQYSAAFGSATASGPYSFAAGCYSTASGGSSTALGSDDYASGACSTAMGEDSSAVGLCSTAMGEFAYAGGTLSTAMGFSYTSGTCSTAMGNSNASGDYSTAIGDHASAASYCSTAIGQYNIGTATSATTWVLTDPLFEIGNGTGSGQTPRSDALIVYKNGTVAVPTALRCAPTGDLSMGAFTAGTHP